MSSLRQNMAEERSASNTRGADCWQEMQALSAVGGHASWATLVSQRPATEERLSRLVGTLERDIIPRLVRAHASEVASPDGPLPTADEVASFTQSLLGHDETALHVQLVALRNRGVGVSALFVHLLAPTAYRLGQLWEDDHCHFAEVTIGVGRLQQIMRGLSSAFGTDIDPPAGGRRALLMPAPGEQHTFGLSMVAEFFAHAGWEVGGVLDPLSTSFQDRVAQEWFDLVGISAGSSSRLDDVRACVAAVRQHSHNRAVAVIVGGPLFVLHPDLEAQVQADAVITDGQQAPRLAEQLLGRRAKSR